MLSPCGSSRSNPHSLNLLPHEHWRALRVLGVDVFSNLNCSHADFVQATDVRGLVNIPVVHLLAVVGAPGVLSK